MTEFTKFWREKLASRAGWEGAYVNVGLCSKALDAEARRLTVEAQGLRGALLEDGGQGLFMSAVVQEVDKANAFTESRMEEVQGVIGVMARQAVVASASGLCLGYSSPRSRSASPTSPPSHSSSSLDDRWPPLACQGPPPLVMADISAGAAIYASPPGDAAAATAANEPLPAAWNRCMDAVESCQLDAHRSALEECYRQCCLMHEAGGVNCVALELLAEDYTARVGGAPPFSMDWVLDQPFVLHPQRGEGNWPVGETAERFRELAGRVEEEYALRFQGGDRDAARGALRTAASAPPRTGTGPGPGGGVVAGCVLAALVVAAWLAMLPLPRDDCPFCSDYALASAPVFRTVALPVLYAFLYYACVVPAWRRAAVNFSPLLGLDVFGGAGAAGAGAGAGSASVLVSKPPVPEGGGMAALLALFCAVDLAAFLGAVRTGFLPLGLPLGYYPAAAPALAVLAIVSPLGRRARGAVYYSTAALWSAAKAPFGGPVRFQENVAADVATSMVTLLRDLGDVTAFYRTGGFSGVVFEPISLGQHVYSAIITALPYWWRLMQCLRRARDSGPGPGGDGSPRAAHLGNAAKYLVSIAVISLSSVFHLHHFYPLGSPLWTPARAAWAGLLVGGTLYSYWWDVVMDWGLLRVRRERLPGGGLGPPRLRLELEARPCAGSTATRRRRISAGFALWAMVSNLLGRFFWAATISPFHLLPATALPAQVVTTMVAVVEVARRAQWLVLRVELEFSSSPEHSCGIWELPPLKAGCFRKGAGGGGRPWGPLVTAWMALVVVGACVVYAVLTDPDKGDL